MLTKNYWEIVIKPFPHCATPHRIMNAELKMLEYGGIVSPASIQLKFEMHNLNYAISKIYQKYIKFITLKAAYNQRDCCTLSCLLLKWLQPQLLINLVASNKSVTNVAAVNTLVTHLTESTEWIFHISFHWSSWLIYFLLLIILYLKVIMQSALYESVYYVEFHARFRS